MVLIAYVHLYVMYIRTVENVYTMCSWHTLILTTVS